MVNTDSSWGDIALICKHLLLEDTKSIKVDKHEQITH